MERATVKVKAEGGRIAVEVAGLFAQERYIRLLGWCTFELFLAEGIKHRAEDFAAIGVDMLTQPEHLLIPETGRRFAL
jgi:hypothetical protein